MESANKITPEEKIIIDAFINTEVEYVKPLKETLFPHIISQNGDGLRYFTSEMKCIDDSARAIMRRVLQSALPALKTVNLFIEAPELLKTDTSLFEIIKRSMQS